MVYMSGATDAVQELKTVSVTKPLAAAGNYAANDVMSESASSGTVWLFPAIARANGGSGLIVKAQAIMETTNLTPRLILHLFIAAPTSQLNDNEPNTALLHADLANYVGPVEFSALRTSGGDSETIATPSTVGNVPLAFTCASDADDLIGIVATLDAITGEVATDDLTIVLEVEQF